MHDRNQRLPATAPWLHAYDVQDFACLVHPLAGSFARATHDASPSVTAMARKGLVASG